MNRTPRSLLFACTRNAVRSPMAEALARQRLEPGTVISSAGEEPGTDKPL
ncbi:MAG: protein-tyrosine-phosphatase, partial [Alphaproteobacteria bacterium]|nr:protein-tyrosine-phosphatase [Alphaproteobacteria bacterium]